MGRETRFFRQSKQSLVGNQGAQNYAQQQRGGSWHQKIWKYIKIKGGQVSSE